MEKSYKFKYQSSKKTLQAITRFTYHLQQIIPSIFPIEQFSQSAPLEKFQSVVGHNSLMYFWGRGFSEGEPLVNQESIIKAIKSTHLVQKNQFESVFKISDRSYQKVSRVGQGYWSAGWNTSQILQFVLRKEDNKVTKKTKYELYVIHHCQSQVLQQKAKQLKWLNFVQKYAFNEKGIHYDVVASSNFQKTMLGFYNNRTVMQNFVKGYMMFQKFQGHLLKYKQQIKQIKKESQDPAFNQQNKLINQIPSQFIKMFYTLKKQFGADKEELICRFMIAREFKIDQCRQSIKQYIKWHEEFSKKYKWEDFEEFHKMNIFYYLGEDYKGRPVILNKAKNVLVDLMDGDKYCLYYMFYLEIHMPSKMRGYVTQLNIIADVEGLGKNNFKFAITKQNIQDGKKYCVQRQYKFFAVNVSPFANFCWKFIKPLLPKKTLQKVYVGGNSKVDIVESLFKDMSIQVIPRYLGGKNPLI